MTKFVTVNNKVCRIFSVYLDKDFKPIIIRTAQGYFKYEKNTEYKCIGKIITPKLIKENSIFLKIAILNNKYIIDLIKPVSKIVVEKIFSNIFGFDIEFSDKFINICNANTYMETSDKLANYSTISTEKQAISGLNNEYLKEILYKKIKEFSLFSLYSFMQKDYSFIN